MSTWAYVDVSADGIHPAGAEVISKARELDDDVSVVALGPGASAVAETAGAHGATTLYACDDESLAGAPRAAAFVLAGLIERHRPELVLFATTYDSRDVAGRLQARTGSTVMSNATDVFSPDRARTEIFGGTLIVDVDLAGPRPRLVLMKPRTARGAPLGGGSAEVVAVDAAAAGDLVDARIIEHHLGAAEGPSLDDARVVVAGGRGLGGPEGFGMLDELAAAIGGAAVGASRAAVDAGWVPYSYQIGQTGRTVKPDVYLAIGISGALQHVVGMKGAGRVVAINIDPDALIMRMADLGVVGDLREVVPALTHAIAERTASA